MDLKSRLVESAQAWADAQPDGAPLSRIAKRVMDDGKFFESLPQMRRGPTTDTLEKFAHFFADPDNWPEAAIADGLPECVAEFIHAVGVASPSVASSPEKDDTEFGNSHPPAADRSPAATVSPGVSTAPDMPGELFPDQVRGAA